MPGSGEEATVEGVRDPEGGGGRRSRGGDIGRRREPSGTARAGSPPGFVGMLEAGRFTRTNLQERLAGKPGARSTAAASRGARRRGGSSRETGRRARRPRRGGRKAHEGRPEHLENRCGGGHHGQSLRTPAGDGGRSRGKRERPRTRYVVDTMEEARRRAITPSVPWRAGESSRARGRTDRFGGTASEGSTLGEQVSGGDVSIGSWVSHQEPRWLRAGGALRVSGVSRSGPRVTGAPPGSSR